MNKKIKLNEQNQEEQQQQTEGEKKKNKNMKRILKKKEFINTIFQVPKKIEIKKPENNKGNNTNTSGSTNINAIDKVRTISLNSTIEQLPTKQELFDKFNSNIYQNLITCNQPIKIRGSISYDTKKVSIITIEVLFKYQYQENLSLEFFKDYLAIKKNAYQS